MQITYTVKFTVEAIWDRSNSHEFNQTFSQRKSITLRSRDLVSLGPQLLDVEVENAESVAQSTIEIRRPLQADYINAVISDFELNVIGIHVL